MGMHAYIDMNMDVDVDVYVNVTVDEVVHVCGYRC